MPTLSTGLIIAGAYADKLRRTLFAQLSDRVKSGEIDSKEVARAAAEVNQLLFNIIVEDLKMNKGDVVRVRVDYEIEGSQINGITLRYNLRRLRGSMIIRLWM